MPAAAVDHVGRRDLDALVAGKVMHGGDDTVAVLAQALEAMTMPEVDAGVALGKFPQYRIEPELVAALRPLGAGGALTHAAVVRALDARDFEA